jgi:hypothetical protein
MKLVGVVGVQSRKFERQALLRVLQDPILLFDCQVLKQRIGAFTR